MARPLPLAVTVWGLTAGGDVVQVQAATPQTRVVDVSASSARSTTRADAGAGAYPQPQKFTLGLFPVEVAQACRLKVSLGVFPVAGRQ